MKKIAIILLTVISILGKSQIVQETTYVGAGLNGANIAGNLSFEYLSGVGYKYSVKTTSTITLYNLNHSVYTTITTPTLAMLSCTNCPLTIWYISNTLFDTNPTTIEYMWVYQYQTSPAITNFRVYDQTGAILLAQDSVNFPHPSAGYLGREGFLNATPGGVKMIVYKTNGAAKVYALPGALPCLKCIESPGIDVSAKEVSQSSIPLNNYPNPASEQTTIDYQLPTGINHGVITIYDQKAVEVKRYDVTSDFSNLVLNVSDLAAGIYYYQISTSAGAIGAKKMVVIK